MPVLLNTGLRYGSFLSEGEGEWSVLSYSSLSNFLLYFELNNMAFDINNKKVYFYATSKLF